VHRPLAVCLALFLAGGVAARQPTFRASTRLVEVTVVVEDGSGRPVEGLSRADFTVYEVGVEVPIEIFAPPPAKASPRGAISRRLPRTCSSEFTDEQRVQLRRDALHISRTVALRAGATRLHVVVRDAPTATTGSLIIRLRR
jgi:hypothetical protein